MVYIMYGFSILTFSLQDTSKEGNFKSIRHMNKTLLISDTNYCKSEVWDTCLITIVGQRKWRKCAQDLKQI